MPATFTSQVTTLGTTIAQIDSQASAQTSATGTISDKVSAAAEAAKELRSGHLVPLKKVAKLITTGSTGGTLSPNFPSTITIPHSHNYEALISAATAAVQSITPYKDLFIARGLPTDFLDQITAQAATLSQAIQSSGSAKATRVATTKDLKQLFQELHSTMHVLDLGVSKACKADRVNGPTTMAGWKNAKTIRKSATPTDIPFTPPASTTTTSPTTPVTAAPASQGASNAA
ncbi:MAG TPA: hypothetical protein VNU46_03975 [Gemmatimonadaceae bacterium]|jgi:hypothetical protein|nr:hypothetical protein [Gemmatimonadaceae bacterium]